ncbi:FBF1 factor, partial [Baryphthengus martii]|nr:FBF1 factor [Baryphthengus martii]
QEMDDLDALLLGLSKPSSGPGKTTMKGPGRHDSLGGGVKIAGKPPTPAKGESVLALEKKPLSFPTASQQYQKFNFEDLDDPLVGLLSDEEQDAPKKPAPAGPKSSPEGKTGQSEEKEPSPLQTPLHTGAPGRRRAELVFEDDGDDFMEALGFDSGPKGNEKRGKKAEEEELRPARSKLDELLGRSSVAKVLEQPGTGEQKEFKLDKKYQKQPGQEESWDKEDFVFGAYQPTVASMPKGQLPRRNSVSRFSAEDNSEPKQVRLSKPPPSATQSPVRRNRSGGDWLGLKDEDFFDLEPSSPVKASPSGSHPSPATSGQPSPASQLPAAKEAVAKPDALEEDWLTAALSRKKAQAQARAQERNAKVSEAPGEGLDPHSPVSQPAASPGAPQPAATLQDKTASTSGSRQPVPWLSTTKEGSPQPSEAAKGDPSRHTSAPGAYRAVVQFGQRYSERVSLPCTKQKARGRSHSITLGYAEAPALGSLHERRLGAPTAHLQEDALGCQAALLSAQARVAELESQQVRILELERTQQKLLLESLQQRHQEELDLLESSYRNRMKRMEETYGQLEERLWRMKEQLEAQLLSQSQEAERARAELKQQNVLELERVRELQRASVQEMRRDHEDQLQRLRRLKDQEIEAVTSATSHTRSLNNVIEHIEKFFSDLHELSQKMEATHHTTSQELATEARQRDKQLKALQDRLLQQQRDMEEERNQLQEAAVKMETRLSEQTRLLEQERCRVTKELSKVESLQHSLEEQQRVMTHQLSMERAELERTKSALLEEQKLTMQKCSEERRKLAAEWAEFHTWQQLSKERMELDMGRALQMDSQREDTIMTLVKEQAELKIQSRKLKAKEEQLVRDRMLLEEAHQELRLEKEKVDRAALHIRQQEEEVKNMMRLSPQKDEEAERARWEACRRESGHQSRLQGIQQLRQQEQQLLQ